MASSDNIRTLLHTTENILYFSGSGDANSPTNATPYLNAKISVSSISSDAVAIPLSLSSTFSVTNLTGIPKVSTGSTGLIIDFSSVKSFFTLIRLELLLKYSSANSFDPVGLLLVPTDGSSTYKYSCGANSGDSYIKTRIFSCSLLHNVGNFASFSPYIILYNGNWSYGNNWSFELRILW